MKYRKCPAAPNCWDYKAGCCEDCAHSAKYQKLFRKIERQEKEITRLKAENTKAEPRKPRTETEDDRFYMDYICPTCGVILQQAPKQNHSAFVPYKAKYCQDCGQALDWSVVPKAVIVLANSPYEAR